MKTLLYEKYPIFRLNIFLIFTTFILNLSFEEDIPLSSFRHISDTEEHICPSWGSLHTVKNESTHNSKPKRLCKSCGRQFVINPKNKTISPETKALIDKLLLERISMLGIVRVTGVSLSWLQNYVNNKFDSIQREIKVSAKPKGRLTIECDEMWSFYVTRKNINYGRVFRLFIDNVFIDNVPLLILIFGTLIERLFRANVKCLQQGYANEQLARKPDKQIILSA